MLLVGRGPLGELVLVRHATLAEELPEAIQEPRWDVHPLLLSPHSEEALLVLDVNRLQKVVDANDQLLIQELLQEWRYLIYM